MPTNALSRSLVHLADPDVFVDYERFGEHTFSPSHIYMLSMIGRGSPIELRIFDQHAGDNSGSLTVYLYADAWFEDCNANDVPDDCEPDFDSDGITDDCDDDIDNDGIDNDLDECIYTPAGAAVDANGRPLGDIDLDCDTDLDDYAMFHDGFTGTLSR